MNRLSEAYYAYITFWVKRIGMRNVLLLTIAKFFAIGIILGLLI